VINQKRRIRKMAKVLLVDDDEDMLAMSARWLEKAGYEVIKETSGQGALAALENEGADIVLLDYAMPGMTGSETLKEIRANEKLSQVPVVMRTGMDDKEIADEVEALHPQKILPKSEGKAVLLAVVAEILG